MRNMDISHKSVNDTFFLLSPQPAVNLVAPSVTAPWHCNLGGLEDLWSRIADRGQKVEAAAAPLQIVAHSGHILMGHSMDREQDC